MRTSLDSLAAYLKDYAEPTTEIRIDRIFDSAVVVPLLGEDTRAFMNSITQASQARDVKTLIIGVVNNRVDHPHDWIKINSQLISGFSHSALKVSQKPPAYFRDNVLLIDRSTSPWEIPPKQGVGLARKIGCDIAVHLMVAGKVKHLWIRCLDADCEIDDDYFEEITAAPSTCLYPFEHILNFTNAVEAEALRLYDDSIRYYVRGLSKAGSPYAFYSLGSTLAIHAELYAKVRGFPKVSAAEDFYMLSKLAKVGTVSVLARKPVRIQQRISSRVPFGTGVSTRKIAEDLKNGQPFRVYHPDSFTFLGDWLKFCCTFSADPHACCFKSAFEASTLTREVLDSLGALEALEIARATRTNSHQRYKHLMDWFDAFRTLKFIHGLRNRGLGMVEVAGGRVACS